MLRKTLVVLRRGKPRPRVASFGLRNTGVPASHKPSQGGQPLFHQYLLRQANEEAAAEYRREQYGDDGAAAAATGRDAASDAAGMTLEPRHPLARFAEARTATAEKRAAATAQWAADDEFVSRRTFNELEAYERAKGVTMRPDGKFATRTAADEPPVVASADGITRLPGVVSPRTDSDADDAAAGAAAALPEDVPSADYFQATFGYSMIKDGKSMMQPVDVQYNQLDMWAEQPKYTAGTYFLYLVSRRRNVYAVMYDFEGKRLLNVYSAGNRGFKGTDKGFRSEGSAETAHQVTSQYLNDVIPKVREAEMAAGRSKAGDSKPVDVVVRLLGFYNGRSGAIRAVNDRSDVLRVRYMEDITPFPLNGPRLPKRKPKLRQW